MRTDPSEDRYCIDRLNNMEKMVGNGEIGKSAIIYYYLKMFYFYKISKYNISNQS